LAAFPNGEVARQLSALAADGNTPTAQRLAAVSALVPNADRREVMSALVSLLDTQDPLLTARIVKALSEVSGADYGSDIDAWKRWWANQSALPESDRLHGQVRGLLRRVAQLQQELTEAGRVWAGQRSDLARSLAEVLAANYRLTLQPEQKDELLLSWLGDPAVEFRKVAARLVAEQISEGNPPSETVRSALRGRFYDDSPEVRNLAIEVIGALNEPSDADAMLARLELERDEHVRATILRVLGKLRNPAAIPTLVAELQRGTGSESSLACAADALGMLAGQGLVDQGVVDSLVEPLKDRYATLDQDSRTAKVAILGAMAAIGSPEFKPEFEANLSADDPELLLRAIRGVAVVGNGAQLDRLGNLLLHPDARVRQRTLAAVGELGGEEQLSIIIPRLNPSAEPIEGPREAAWQALNQIARRMPITAQARLADRLSDHPALAIEYLRSLHDSLVTIKPPPTELPVVREKLARLFGSLQRWAEALPYWRQLHAVAAQVNDPRTVEFALELLKSALLAERRDRIDEALDTLAATTGTPKREAQEALIAYVEGVIAEGDRDRLEAVVREFEGMSSTDWPALSEYLSARLPTDEGEASSRPSNSE
jgi:HEAT repeat protein